MNGNTPVPSPAGRSRLRTSGRALRRLSFGLWLICAAAALAAAQEAQTVKSAQPVVCGDTSYDLRLVHVKAPIGAKSGSAKTAHALGIVLTPADPAQSKTFFLYWLNEQAKLPTHRDDTTGKPALLPYNKGQTDGKVPVVESFFSEAKCSDNDQQVVALQSALDTIASAPNSLRSVATDMNGRGVAVDPGQVEDASAAKLSLFTGLPSDETFLKAVQQYVSTLVAAGGGGDGQGSNKGSSEIERNRLLGQIKILTGQVEGFEREKKSLFGGAPGWLVIGFFIASAVSLSIIGYIGLVYYDNRKRKVVPSGGQAAQLSQMLREIINTARYRRQSINDRYPNVSLSSDGGVYQQIAGDLDAAYTDLQEELEGLQKRLPRGEGTATVNAPPVNTRSALPADPQTESSTDASLKNSSAEKEGAPPPVDSGVAAELSQLRTEFAAVKTRVESIDGKVDGFDGKLDEHLVASHGLHDIWSRLRGGEYNQAQANVLLREVGEVIDLYKYLRGRCSQAGAPIATTKGSLEVALAQLEEIRKTYLGESVAETVFLHNLVLKIKDKLSEDAKIVGEYGQIAESLRGFYKKDMKPAKTVADLLAKLSLVWQKVGTYHPGRSVPETLDDIVATYEGVTAEVKGVLPEASGTLQAMVALLVADYKRVEPEAKRVQELETVRDDLQQQLTTAEAEAAAGKELGGEVAHRLNYKTERPAEDPLAVADVLKRVRREAEEGVYLQLRLGLSSALLALEKATGTGSTDEQRKVIEALLLDNVIKGIKDLLAEMEEYSGEELWNSALARAFREKWLHFLLRADLLLRTYYGDQKDFGLLRKAVSLASSAVLVALYEFHVEVVEVALFGELPGDMLPEAAYPGLRTLRAVREKVQSIIQRTEDEEVVVDVTSFPYSVKGVPDNRGSAARANPSAWLQY